MAEDTAETEDSEDSEEQPAIDEEQMADMSDVADAIEAEADAEEDTDESDDSDSEGGLDAPGETSVDTGPDTSIGDVYCNALGMATTMAKDTHGGGIEGERKEHVDKYADMARDLEIDEYVDEWIDSHGGPDNLSPGQAVLVFSVVYAGMVVMEDPEILEGIQA